MATEFFIYGDETGIVADQDFCAVVAYLGDADAWQAFTPMWRRITSESGVDFFHARDFFGRDRDGNRLWPYTNWSAKKSDAFLERLIETIHDSDVVPMACAVDWKAFRKLAEGERRFLTGGRMTKSWTRWKRNGAVDKPYYLALSGVVATVDRSTKLHKYAKLQFVFARQELLQEHAIRSYADMLAVERDEGRDVSRYGEIRFADPVKTVELQPADLLGYSWQRFLRFHDAYHGWIVERIRKGSKFGVLAADELEWMLSRIPPDERKALRSLGAP